MRNIEEMLTDLLIENTQIGLAGKLGTSTKSIQNWISGSFNPAKGMVKKIKDLYEQEKPTPQIKDFQGKVMEALIRIEARQIAHESHFAEIYAKLGAGGAAKILKELQEAGNKEENRLRDELKK